MRIKKNGIIHQVAYCPTCGKEWSDYKQQKARKRGYAHAKLTGHEVFVESMYSIVYNLKSAS